MIAGALLALALGAPPADRDAAIDPWWRTAPSATLPESQPSSGWIHSPIDAFVLAELQRRGLTPAPPADRRTWLRRVTFDLTGLPPTPDEAADFLADVAPSSHDRVVDRLLASPRYGECWGRRWLDVARYADTSGDGTDMPIPEARLYRDYVIDAFNDDLPFDDFLVEQIAGDVLAEEEPDTRVRERRIATGFVAVSRRFGNGTYSDMHLVIDNTIETISEGVLGMSVQCARCHDHKFDPIPTEDYYGWYGYFASTQYPHAGSEHGKERLWFLSLAQDRDEYDAYRVQEARKVELLERNADLRRSFGERDALTKKVHAKRTDRDRAVFDLAADPSADAVEADRLTDLEHDLARLEPALRELANGEDELEGLFAKSDDDIAWGVQDKATATGDARVHRRGNPDDPGDVAPRGFLRALTDRRPMIPDGRSGRLALARWLAAPDNPLTARVFVNRLWQGHFGRGLVATTNVFGAQGELATHPELLDWLAARFVAGGWSIKAMHREIVLSSTYRMASRGDEVSATRDPDARWLSRFPSQRLDAEAIRDAMLAVSGRLQLDRPGRHPFPKSLRFTQHRPFEDDYDHRHRSVYLMSRRLTRSPLYCLFDGPDPNRATGSRRPSTVPQQALFFMNNSFVRDCATALAERVSTTASDPRARVAALFELAYQRPARHDEIDLALRYHRDYSDAAAIEGEGDRDPDRAAWVSLSRALLASNEFVHIE